MFELCSVSVRSELRAVGAVGRVFAQSLFFDCVTARWSVRWNSGTRLSFVCGLGKMRRKLVKCFKEGMHSEISMRKAAQGLQRGPGGGHRRAPFWTPDNSPNRWKRPACARSFELRPSVKYPGNR